MPPSRTNELLDNLYVTTLAYREKPLTNNIFEHSEFWIQLKKRGHLRKFDGYRRIELNVKYAKNSTVVGITRGSTIGPQDEEFVTVVEYDWKFIAGSATRFYTDMKRNRGKARLRDLVNDTLDNLSDSIGDKIETDLYLDGSGDGGLTIDGLQKLVPDNGTDSCGGLSGITYPWWVNKTKDMTGLALSTNLRPKMVTMYNDCSKLGNGNTRFTNFLITTQAIVETYDNEAFELRSIVNKQDADLAMGELKFHGLPLYWSPSATDYRLYFLNMNYLFFAVMDSGAIDFTRWKDIPNSLDSMMHGVLNGNLALSCRQAQGVMFNTGN